MEPFYKKFVFKNFVILTEKYLCWILCLIQNITKSILKYRCVKLLLKMCSWNWENLKIVDKGF